MAAAVQCVVLAGWFSLRQSDHARRHLQPQRRDARRSRLVPKEPIDALLREAVLPAPDHRLGHARLTHDRMRPSPSALSSTIRARQTCFCDVFRSARVLRAEGDPRSESVKEMPLRIPPDSQDGPQTETPHGLNRQGSTTSGRVGSPKPASHVSFARRCPGSSSAIQPYRWDTDGTPVGDEWFEQLNLLARQTECTPAVKAAVVVPTGCQAAICAS